MLFCNVWLARAHAYLDFRLVAGGRAPRDCSLEGVARGPGHLIVFDLHVTEVGDALQHLLNAFVGAAVVGFIGHRHVCQIRIRY